MANVFKVAGKTTVDVFGAIGTATKAINTTITTADVALDILDQRVQQWHNTVTTDADVKAADALKDHRREYVLERARTETEFEDECSKDAKLKTKFQSLMTEYGWEQPQTQPATQEAAA